MANAVIEAKEGVAPVSEEENVEATETVEATAEVATEETATQE
jgi:hypothetical protein